MNTLNIQLNQLEMYIAKQDKLDVAVSKSPVGWHIEHSLLTINAIVNALQQSNPENYKWSFNIIRVIVLTIKKIPRGKGKAPAIVQPKDYNTATLAAHIQGTKEKIAELQNISPNQYFQHPFFGHIKLKKTIAFLKIHTQHHLSIINDIAKNS